MDWRTGFIMGLVVAFLIGSLARSNLFRKKSARPNKLISPRKSSINVMSNAVELRLSMGPSIVALGGGTGLSSLLSGLKCFTRNITAVVTVTDEGGSSGRLTQEWGVLPPGDIRNCVVALAENDNALSQILDFRFDKGDLKGHSLGNLILLAVTEMSGDFRLGVEKINNLLAIRGKVLPVTTESVCLCGRLVSGKIIKGELQISKHGSEIEEVWLEPQNAKPLKDISRAIDGADLIVLGPGSLFTSVLPNLLIEDLARKLRASNVPKVYVSNLMTQPGETDGFNIIDHVNWIESCLGQPLDYILVNMGSFSEEILANYSEQGADALFIDEDQVSRLESKGCKVIHGNFARISEECLVRHDGQSVSEVLMKICRERNEG
ncbi:MAG TPA: uridine diphosphate-N-acetylglucosamine-binding protein YvcK [Synergistales bacterium]|mgnify:CR=1 FL=1|nr:uridine diphosphate-N-acetylglucosamine-binding protein YvcK [Synergistales bacterium]